MIIGIDPGLTGGLATVSSDGLWIEPMPRNEAGVDALELVRLLHECRNAKAAYVEKVHAMPKQGVVSMFNFGKAYGTLIGVLTAIGIPIINVTPQEWQRTMYVSCPTNFIFKERSLWAFAKTFPKVNATLKGSRNPHSGMVEAALIAEYGRRQQQ